MIPEIDIWRAAQLMLKRYGDKALEESVARADELVAAGRPWFVQHGMAHLGWIFVFPQTLVDHLTKEVVPGPCQVFDLDNKLGPNPVDAAENER